MPRPPELRNVPDAEFARFVAKAKRGDYDDLIPEGLRTNWTVTDEMVSVFTDALTDSLPGDITLDDLNASGITAERGALPAGIRAGIAAVLRMTGLSR